MTARTKVGVLLTSVLIFFAAAASASLFVRHRAADALARAAEHDVRLLTLTTHVTAAHMEQAIRLERALRHSRDRSVSAEAREAYEGAKADFEFYSAEIWRHLQEAREAADVQPGPQAGTIELLERIDSEHNAYAEEARRAFELLETGRRGEGVALVRDIARDEDRLEQALGALLVEVSATTERASSGARSDERRASWIVGALMAAGFVLTLSAFVTVMRLVSEMKSLGGLIPICSSCKKIRDDQGYWNQLEAYLEAHSDAAFTHGICSPCQEQMRAELTAQRGAGRGAAGVTATP